MDDVFSTKIEKFRKNNKNLSSQIFVVGNIVNDSLNDKYFLNLYNNKYFISDQAFNWVGCYKETFVKGVYKTLSGAHL